MTNTTNVEFITHLMNYSRHGALMQAFIIEAINQYASDVVVQHDKPEGWQDFLNWDAWHGCATEVIDAINDRHAPSTS